MISYKINSFSLLSATTATTINIPITLEYQLVDNAELVEEEFVDVQVQKAINPILDYDKARFIPVNISDSTSHVVNVIYNVNFLDTNNLIKIPSYYSDLGFNDSDLKFERNNFKESFLSLSFYDSDNPLIQNLVTELDIYSILTRDSFYPAGSPKPIIPGQPKPAGQIPVKFTLSNPLLVSRGFYEGYHIYDYKDEYVIGLPQSLYMKGTYMNAKTGSITNLMTEPIAYKIDNLVNKLYTKYNLFRDTTGFYYQVDNSYGTNVIYSTNAGNPNNSDVTINLYQIQVL